MSLSGLVVFVAGASKGIGKDIALRAAADGANVVINYLSDVKAANALVMQIGSDRALAVQGDVSKLTEIDMLIEATISRFGKIDVLIPNAAFVPHGDLRSITEENFDRAFAVNVKGPCFLAKKAMRYMKPGSTIIFISTDLTEASSVSPELLLYVSTKGALNQMVRILARDLAREGIRVNAISPGATNTELFRNAMSDEQVRIIASQNPYGKIGEPYDVAAAVGMLWGKDSSWVTGQVLMVNGGSMV